MNCLYVIILYLHSNYTATTTQMKLLLVLATFILSAYAAYPCGKAVADTRNSWTNEAATGNASNPASYNWVAKQGPALPSGVVYTVLPQGFFSRTFVGKAAVIGPQAFGGLGTVIGVISVTVDSIGCYELDAFTHTFARVRKHVIVPGTTSNMTLPYQSDIKYSDDGSVLTIDEFVDPLCTLCLLGGSALLFGFNPCTSCGL